MKKILFFTPAVLYYVLIFYLSSRSYEVKISILFFDKGVHLFEFAFLGFLLSFGYFMSLKSSLMVKAGLTFASGILLGTLDELHQYFVPLRSTEVLDVLADAIGILMGLFVYFYFSQTAKGKSLVEKLSKL